MTKWTSDLVIAQLEEAGRTLLALPEFGTRPAVYRNAATELLGAEAFDFERRRVSVPTPTAEAISAMDRTLFEWPKFIPQALMQLRRIVLRRSLVDPLHHFDRRHVWPWRRLGAAEGISHETCRTRHREGILMIVKNLNRSTTCPTPTFRPASPLSRCSGSSRPSTATRSPSAVR